MEKKELLGWILFLLGCVIILLPRVFPNPICDSSNTILFSLFGGWFISIIGAWALQAKSKFLILIPIILTLSIFVFSLCFRLL